jgi:hypothetical protein
MFQNLPRVDMASHQLPPTGGEGGTAVTTGTASHITQRLRSGPISWSFFSYYDPCFLGAWQLLVSKEGDRKYYIVRNTQKGNNAMINTLDSSQFLWWIYLSYEGTLSLAFRVLDSFLLALLDSCQ